MRSRLGRDLENLVGLYLDGLLTGPARADFERRMQADAALREAVEFHRGLTLEFHEEAPPLPAGYAARARSRLDRTLAAEGSRGEATPRAGGAPIPWWRRFFVLQAIGAGAAVVLVVVLLHPRFTRRAPRGPLPGEPVANGPTSAEERRRGDEETLEALRSLGYIAKDTSSPPAGKTGKTTPERSERKTAPAPAAGRSAETAVPPVAGIRPAMKMRAAAPPVAPQPAAPASSPLPAQSATPSPAPSASPQENRVPYRLVEVSRAPREGSDHDLFRNAEEWAAGVEPGTAPPPADFAREMVILLRDDLGGVPPMRLRVVSVNLASDSIRIECRVEPRDPAVTVSPGQALIVPSSDLPVRLLVP